jgi:cytochrome c oxidase subunit II
LENALGLSGGQALLMTITIGITVLGLVGLALALFMEKRWKLTYNIEYLFIAALLVMAYYGDWASTGVYKAYQEDLRANEPVSGKFVTDAERDKKFDRILTVIAFQWGFAFITDEKEISRNAAIVKAGERVLFKVVTNDVIHGFNIPVAGITAEIDPGDVRELWIRAPSKPGKYLIQCVNYCGVGHAQMKAWLVVEGNTPTAELKSGEKTNGA